MRAHLAGLFFGGIILATAVIFYFLDFYKPGVSDEFIKVLFCHRQLS